MAMLRAARANRVFCADEKRIRAENTVLNKSMDSAVVSYKILDCARMEFHPRAIEDPRGRLLVRATSGCCAAKILLLPRSDR
jgi:hypothetical protein